MKELRAQAAPTGPVPPVDPVVAGRRARSFSRHACYFSMAERRELPGVFGRVHARFHTPYVAILSFSLIGWGLAVSGTFESNATLSAIVRLVTYGLTCAALPVFRRRLVEPPGFRLPAAGLVVPLGLGFGLWLLFDRARRAFVGSQADLDQAQMLVGLIVLGTALFYAARWQAAR